MAEFNENYFKDDHSPMGSAAIEDMLAEGESILWRGKPKKSAFILSRVLKMLPFALIWLVFDGGFIGLMVGLDVFSQMPPVFTVFICVFFAFHLIPVWIWISHIVTANRQHKNLEYAFTDRRIIIRSGVIGVDVNNLYYTDIQNVNLKVGLIDRWLKVGDIYVKSASQAQVLWDIEQPYTITTKLQKITADIKADIYYPNALRPAENEGYKTNYKG
ncbi:MAG: hypothetical protein DBX59_07925 [Bacillota bacterium]|nr:MAG: hypothetical protein DBX59_07925 [Bacillota bacterium]